MLLHRLGSTTSELSENHYCDFTVKSGGHEPLPVIVLAFYAEELLRCGCGFFKVDTVRFLISWGG